MEHYNKEDEAALVRTLLYLLRNQRRRAKVTKETTREEVLTIFRLLWEHTDDIDNQVPGEFTMSVLLSLVRRCDFSKIDISNDELRNIIVKEALHSTDDNLDIRLSEGAEDMDTETFMENARWNYRSTRLMQLLVDMQMCPYQFDQEGRRR
jgi:hypothetical protein